MAVELEKYQDILAELGAHASEVLRASWDIGLYRASAATLRAAGITGVGFCFGG
ncbi:hypothetical protein [Acidithiobacillus ferriphilus]|uniref:hypothetical protein n=1 Tax=Acidithiobacillus ferriphilus TaxID=1689834 RepID=UPI001C0712E5|nr:hypothetical protein [Acidithiobacillus ferriphilus]MBU2828709.1 hypothetical protein [Acidithiobacillus ferriphilus]